VCLTRIRAVMVCLTKNLNFSYVIRAVMSVSDSFFPAVAPNNKTICYIKLIFWFTAVVGEDESGAIEQPQYTNATSPKIITLITLNNPNNAAVTLS
jgi:hypothetical protein